MNKKHKKLLQNLDSIFAPNGSFNQSAYEFFLNKNAESLYHMTEPSLHEDEDLWNQWNESSQKHQIFDFLASKRPRILNKPYLQSYNDLAWAIVLMTVNYSNMDQEIENQIIEWNSI
jgi:hypothetical protein